MAIIVYFLSWSLLTVLVDSCEGVLHVSEISIASSNTVNAKYFPSCEDPRSSGSVASALWHLLRNGIVRSGLCPISSTRCQKMSASCIIAAQIQRSVVAWVGGGKDASCFDHYGFHHSINNSITNSWWTSDAPECTNGHSDAFTIPIVYGYPFVQNIHPK